MKTLLKFMFSFFLLFNLNSTLLAGDMPAPKVVKASNHIQTIVLGSGCFWGAEKRYENTEGVINAESGYADGKGFKATYKEITKNKRRFDNANYAEVVKVTFNSNVISLKKLLKYYFENHNPTQLNRQGNDIGTQYRSTILYTDENQLAIIDPLIRQYQKLLTENGYGKIVTKVKPLVQFFSAEEYHQNYLVKNPNGYCPDHSTGVRFVQASQKKVDNTLLLSGKHIVIIDSKTYCPYCEKLKKTVLNNYQGTIDIHYRFSDQLHSLDIISATWATPTILFLENAKEVFAHQGFMNRKDFYKALGAFKLGNTEAYKVAFDSKTDRPYCKQYDIFKNTPEGTFIDKLSGVPLFSTQDRFKSGTGWLSFTRAIGDSVTYHTDNRYGMKRTEIRSKSSGIHLGHVFENEGPGRSDRYCINATVLEFIPNL